MKINSSLLTIIKGLFIGIANIIPGVSGGTMAVSVGAYDELIGAVNHVRKDWRKSAKTLAPYVIGAGIGIGLLSFVIEGAMATYPLATACLFLGLILGGVPTLWNKAKSYKVSWPEVLSFIIMAGTIVFMTFTKTSDAASGPFSLDPVSLFLLFVVGIIAAATMVIPGVSGSLVLILLGYYNRILETLSSFIRGVLSLNLQSALDNFLPLLPFGIGVLLGIGLVAKLIEWLFEKFPSITYAGIIGLVAASPVAIFHEISLASVTPMMILTAAIALTIGFYISMKLGEK
jgi:putative membrane protein